VLIVANHVSAYDAPLVLYGLPASMRRRVAVAMSGEMLLNFRKGRNLGNWFLNALGPITYVILVGLFNIFPLPQRSSFAKSFRHAAAAMDRGYHVLVFPEGRRSDDGTLAPFQRGSGLLWHELQCQALPVYIAGLGPMKTGKARWFRSGKLKVVTGRPLRYPEALSPSECARLLEQSVVMLEQKPAF
jgi:long-chain acyl-CoA synthetase